MTGLEKERHQHEHDYYGYISPIFLFQSFVVIARAAAHVCRENAAIAAITVTISQTYIEPP